jgi:hypothetical protein
MQVRYTYEALLRADWLYPDLKKLSNELWQAMLEYYSPRLQIYRKALRSVFKSSKWKPRIKSSMKKPIYMLSERQAELQGILKDLSSQCHKFIQGDLATSQFDGLVSTCFKVRQMRNARKDLEGLLEDEPLAEKSIHLSVSWDDSRQHTAPSYLLPQPLEPLAILKSILCH